MSAKEGGSDEGVLDLFVNAAKWCGEHFGRGKAESCDTNGLEISEDALGEINKNLLNNNTLTKKRRKELLPS